MPRKGAAVVSASGEIMARINAQMGSAVITTGADPRYRIKRVPTGSYMVDYVTGGGFPRGRHIELYGDESAGKSYIVYMTMVLAQKRGETCALCDGEHVFDYDWFTFLGGSPEDLLLAEPTNAEQTIQCLQLLSQHKDPKSGAPVKPADIVTIDSIASLATREEQDKDITEGDTRIASQARMMSRGLRLVTSGNADTLFLWTNQLRQDIGPGKFGNPTTTPGGRAMRFYATTRIKMTRTEREKIKQQVVRKGQIKDSEVVGGHWVWLRSEKEKSTKPYREGMFFFDAKESRIDSEQELIDLGLQAGVVTRASNTFSVETPGYSFSGMGKAVKEALREDDAFRDDLLASVMSTINGGVNDASEVAV